MVRVMIFSSIDVDYARIEKQNKKIKKELEMMQEKIKEV